MGPGKDCARTNAQASTGKEAATTRFRVVLLTFESHITNKNITKVAIAVPAAKANRGSLFLVPSSTTETCRSAMMASAGMQANQESRVIRNAITVERTKSAN